MKTQPWLAPPEAADLGEGFVVVGAGIAGATAARVLAERGVSVQVIDPCAPASKATGNPAAVLRPVLARDTKDPLSLFYTDAFESTRRRIDSLREQGHTIAGGFDGVLHSHPRAQDMRGRAKHEYLDAAKVQARLGPHARSDGVWLNDAGWVSPVDYCNALLDHSNIEVHQAELVSLAFNGLTWRLMAADESVISQADNVVLANGWRLLQIAQTASLPINPVASQLLHYKDAHSKHGPSVPVVGGGTLCPTADGWMLTAGHWHDTTEDTVDMARNPEILERSADLWAVPDCADDADVRAAVRATSRDYLPMVGGVPDFEQARIVYADLQHGRQIHHYPAAPHQGGLYVLGALGGRGITSAQLCAEVLGSVVFGEAHAWQPALHPLRFLARELKRGKTAP